MLFTSSNCSDIEKYFFKTYVKFREFGDRLFFIQNVYDTRVVGVDEDDVLFELFLSDDHPYEVDYILPNKAVFQWKNHAYLLSRIPARQYKRGLCGENTQVVCISTENTRPVDFKLLKAFVTKQKYFTFTEALKGSSSIESWALSPRFSYTNGKILCDLRQVGQWFEEERSFRVKKPFVEIVRKLMIDNGEHWSIISV